MQEKLNFRSCKVEFRCHRLHYLHDRGAGDGVQIEFEDVL